MRAGGACTFIPGFDRLAEGHGACRTLLRGYALLPSHRGLWNDGADQAGCGIGSANIAEGNGREHTGSYIQSLRISQGSLKELETHVLLAQTVELMARKEGEQILEMRERVGKPLRALIRSLQQR